MSVYQRDGAAVLKCPKCGFTIKVEWSAGDPPIYSNEVEDHHMTCSGDVIQLTHNDGLTPLSEPCPSYCCAQPSPPRLG